MYSEIKAKDPIRQGDIFRWLPKINIVLGDTLFPYLIESTEKGEKEIDWQQFAQTPRQSIDQSKTAISAYVHVNAVFGIVISQDCDASRAEYIAFAEIKPLKEINLFQNLKEPPAPGKVIDIVTKHTRQYQKFYFLSESTDLNFQRKMGVDFDSLFQVSREMLVEHIDLLRIGRLDDKVAWPHFRERVAEFFRRYPYNEWYPLNTEEAHCYEENQKKSDPNFVLDPFYDWQQH